MKKVFLVSGLSLLVSLSAIGHTIRSQDNVNVSHYHFSKCQGGCPDTVGYEQQEKFNSNDRISDGTYEYNCHGRTFDNRNSWIDKSDAWVFGSGNQSVLNPQIGDVVVWFDDGYNQLDGSRHSQITKHTATIIEPWNGLSTKVSSKYGKFGEYRHALSNTVRAYGTNYIYVRLNTTNVYKASENSKISNNLNNDAIVDIDTLNKELLKRWKEEGILTAEERFIQFIDKKLIEGKSNKDSINVLITDLLREERKFYMGSLSLPEMSAISVTKIESGKLLLEIVRNNPELSQEIGDDLKEIIMSKSNDSVRGIAMYYLSEVEKISGLSWNIGDLFPEILDEPNEMLYFDYYLNKSQN